MQDEAFIKSLAFIDRGEPVLQADCKHIVGGLTSATLNRPIHLYQLLLTEANLSKELYVLLQNPRARQCEYVANLIGIRKTELSDILDELLFAAKQAFRESRSSMQLRIADDLFLLGIHGIFSKSSSDVTLPFLSLRKFFFKEMPSCASTVDHFEIRQTIPIVFDSKLQEIWNTGVKITI